MFYDKFQVVKYHLVWLRKNLMNISFVKNTFYLEKYMYKRFGK